MLHTQNYIGLAEKSEDTELRLGLSLADSQPSYENSGRRRLYSEASGRGEEREREREREREKGLLSLQIGGHSEDSCVSPNSRSPAVGWPPVRSCRKISHSVVSPRSPNNDNGRVSVEDSGSGNESFVQSQETSSALFVKVMMDGVPIMRKLDLNAHSSYNSLVLAVEDMFQPYLNNCDNNEGQAGPRNPKQSLLFDESYNYFFTYLDKDGDWMLVGDCPWRMFINSVKRLRIAKRSEAHGLDIQGFAGNFPNLPTMHPNCSRRLQNKG